MRVFLRDGADAASTLGDKYAFLTVEEVIQIHADVIDEIMPGEPKDVLDLGRLEAAVLAPQQTFGGEYVYSSVYHMAAAYFHGLATGHAFQQANKRIAVVACGAFLRLNRLRLTLSDDQVVDATFRVLSHELDRDGLARLIEEHCEAIPD
jgi:death on curing protein